MNSFQDLARRVDDVTVPTLDVDELIARGEHRLRRRRMAAVLATVTVVAAIAVGGFVAGTVRNQSNGPVNQPNEDKTNQPDQNNASVPVTREIVYFDFTAGADGAIVHYGRQVLDLGNDWFFMDVTDDGLVYQRDGTPRDNMDLMFTDGGKPERISSDVCRINPAFPGTQVKAANEGSLVTWFDCSGPPPAELVVFDTSLGREVARQPVKECGMKPAFFGCEPSAIIDDHVYFSGPYFLDSGAAMLRFDVSTGRLSKDKAVPGPFGRPVAQSYLDDIRSHARGLVIGDSWETGMATPRGGFRVVGRRLVPETRLQDGSPGPLSSAFDTVTQQPVRLRLPPGYHGASSFEVFEWLNDDTIALIGPTGWDDAPGYGDILTCRLSDGHCDLAARGHGPVRVEANGSLPG
jgi:hypothetical protein